jgi:hypothetical protein
MMFFAKVPSPCRGISWLRLRGWGFPMVDVGDETTSLGPFFMA